MVFKFKNDREDVEALLEYNYLHLFSWKIYNLTLISIAIVTPLILVISAIRTEPLFFQYIFISSIFILFMIGLTLFAIYIFLKIIPKLMRKKLK